VDDLFREGGVTQILSSQVPILTSATEGVSVTETPAVEARVLEVRLCSTNSPYGMVIYLSSGLELEPVGPSTVGQGGAGNKESPHEEGHP